MLKKLYKYDLKSVSLLLVILHAVLIVYTVIGRIGIFIAERAQAFVSLEASRLWGIAGAFYIIGFILFILAIVLATVVYLAVRIQKNLFSDEPTPFRLSPLRFFGQRCLLSGHGVSLISSVLRFLSLL